MRFVKVKGYYGDRGHGYAPEKYDEIIVNCDYVVSILPIAQQGLGYGDYQITFCDGCYCKLTAAEAQKIFNVLGFRM